MRDINKVILAGRLGAEPVLRETKSGQSVTYFPLATSRRVNNGAEGDTEPKWTDVTQWHRVTTWGKLADYTAKHLKKGYSVLLEGSVRTHQFQGKDGEAKTSFEVHADTVSLLGVPNGEARGNADEDVPRAVNQ